MIRFLRLLHDNNLRSIWRTFRVSVPAVLLMHVMVSRPCFAEAAGMDVHATAIGPATAPVTIAVFSDFECPFSASTFFTLEQLHSRYPQDVEIVMKQSPLSIHNGAEEAHRAALAAALQGKFIGMSELLYANQQAVGIETYRGYARKLGLNVEAFERDLHSPAVAAALNADEAEARALNIEQTPTLFVNGNRLNGTQSMAKLSALVEKARLDRAATAGPASPVALASAGKGLAPELRTALLAEPSAARGRSGAPLTIVEFTDFRCPFCRSAAGPLEEFAAAHPEEVRVVYRAFPLDMHPNAQLAAEAALAAGAQGKFWNMHDLMFDNQRALSPDDLHGYAAQLGLNLAAFDEALKSHRYAADVAFDRALGTRVDVEGTPTFFVDGSPSIGAHSVAEWDQLLAQHATGAQRSTIVSTGDAAAGSVDDRVVLGTTNAPVRVVWFTDVRSRTAAAQAASMRRLIAEGNGKVRVVVKIAPLAIHADGVLGGEALLAAFHLGKFWEMFDALAAKPEVLTQSSVLSLAVALKLDPAAFDRELTLSRQRVRRDQDEVQERGILRTPVIFVGRQRFDGFQDLAMKAAVLPVSSRWHGQGSAGKRKGSG